VVAAAEESVVDELVAEPPVDDAAADELVAGSLSCSM
jgi:hypothetical protein